MKDDERAWWWQIDPTKPELKKTDFTHLDFLDLLHQFEFNNPKPAGLSYGNEEEAAVGSFCFWTTRSEDEKKEWRQIRPCYANPTILEVFQYIHRRGILMYGQKHYEVLGSPPNYNAWLARKDDWEAGDYSQANIAESFITPDPRWLNWRNSSGTEDDPIVEWGNDVPGHNDELYANAAALNRGQGRLTNQIAVKSGNSFYFTFCQLVYYQQPWGSIAIDSKCGDHLAP
jgi:hypothetical protein